MTMILKLDHVAIIVEDLDKSIAFYEQVLGLVVRMRAQNDVRQMAFLHHPNQPDMEIELIMDIIPQGTYAKSGIVNHLALTVSNMDEAIERCQAYGIHVDLDSLFVTKEQRKIVFAYGPSGEMLQFVQPAPTQ